MRTMKGPGIFLSQFIGGEAPFNTLDGLAEWAASKGYKAVQIPCNHPHIFDVEKAAESQAYCDDITAKLAAHGLVISELSTHLEGQLVAVNPVYSEAFDHFAPASVRGNDAARQAWATEKLKQAAVASARLGLKAHATFSGSLAWPFFYPWPPHNEQRFQEAFEALATRWRPILDTFDEQGVDVCFELHPGEDLHDGVTFERFLALVDNHPRCNILYDPSHMLLQQMDYLTFIDLYHARIKAFHVKDAEFRPSGRSGVYGGYQPWINRAGRFRSLGDGQIDFKGIFSKLTQYDYDGWAVLPKVKRVVTPLGVGSHLRYWGMNPEIIDERDWNQSVRISDALTVHVLPARHFSGRGIKRNQTLWGSFMFVSPEQKVYYSGDSGYGPHFKAIGEQFGGVDLAIMENGQYDQDWKYIHMHPAETAQASADLNARAVVPGHNGRFVLAKHTWNDPLIQLAKASKDKNYRLLTPELGEPVRVSDTTQQFREWWE
ncbi:TIM barrel protein [Enterobacter hormaechei subsp. hoffmannii]